MSEQQSSYRKIMKATSIFGGVQVFKIIIAVIRSKFIAVLLGPAGMGITGLLTSTTGLVSAITDFGLATSGVKNVAAVNSTGNQRRISVIVTVVRRWVWVTGLLGMIVTIITAPLLSKLTFGNDDFTFPFIWISVSLLLTQLSNGQLILLQGMRKIQHLAKANLAGSALSLVLTVPLYYWFGIEGIVPAIVISALITFLGTWYFARKIPIEKVKVSRLRTIAEGKDMLTMGFMISLSGLATLGASYLIRIFINHKGSVDDVGLYSAGFALINTYLGLVFNAMATDYLPRLSGLAGDNMKCRQAINQQAEISILLLTPIIILFLVFIKYVIIVLYSSKFTAIDNMINWAMLGILFKAASWSVSFLFMAKGDSKLFLVNELTANAYFLGLNILGYYYLGLDGLGIAFVAGYFLYLVQVFVISRYKYGFNFEISFIKMLLIQLALIVFCFFMVNLLFKAPVSYFLGSALLIVSMVFSLFELNKRLGFRSMIESLKIRK